MVFSMIQESILNDPKVFAQVYDDLKAYELRSGIALESSRASNLDQLFQSLPGKSQGTLLESLQVRRRGMQLDVHRRDEPSLPFQKHVLEAIVQIRGRPSLLIRGDSWQDPKNDEIRSRLESARTKLVPCFAKVGRIDGPSGMYGTGWLFEEDMLVTNAHVAKRFLSKDGGSELSYSFDDATSVDMSDAPKWNQPQAAKLVKLMKFEPEKLDLAVFKISWKEGGSRAESLILESKPGIDKLLDVAAVGYPEDDNRERRFDVLSNFEGDFQVKRLSPGKIIGYDHPTWFRHDCTTLGGSSGSPLINLETGKVVGLHFAGTRGVANLAIKIERLRKVLGK
jgi:endonuclease G